jgi:oligopeptide/dipeptide ABC transporter ATP-binding protein
MVNELLKVRELTTHFFMNDGIVHAVDGVDLDIEKNQKIGLVGESGSGKSVTALSILRLVPVPGKTIHGSVFFNGKDILKINEDEMREIRGSNIAMVFQDPFTFLNPIMKVKDQIAEMLLTHAKRTNITRKEDVEERVVSLLNQMRIPSVRTVKEYYPHQLSGGMRQRVVLATALACNPDIIILDEPTTALDVTTQMQILELLKELEREKNIAIMLITHDLGIVAELCDKVYIMYAGQIQESANVYDIFDDPKHPYTTGLLETVFSIDEFKPVMSYIEGNVPDMMNPPSGCRFNPRCSYSKGVCKEGRPGNVKVGDDHFVNCWLYA